MEHQLYIIAVPLVLALLDVVSGYASAMKTGTLNSTVMRNGLWNKIAEVFAIIVGKACDICVSLFGTEFLGQQVDTPICVAVCAYLSLYELTSIMENIGKLNPSIGDWLIKKLGIEPYKVGKSDTSWYDDSDIK